MNDNNKQINLSSFDNLNLIPELLLKISMIEDKLLHLEQNLIVPLDLTNRKNVKQYLNISDSTINNMLKDGRFKQGVHYQKVIKKNRVRIIFNHNAIKEFKK